MTFIPDQAKRRMLPRWRPFAATTTANELNSIAKLATTAVVHDQHLDAKLAEWNEGASLPIAVDILTSAVVLGRAKEFERFGWWVLSYAKRNPDLAPAVIDLAEMCVHGVRSPPAPHLRTQQDATLLLRRARGLVLDNPRDAILHVDMALAHAMLGNIAQAQRAIIVATQLAPDNRFVLRSAARFWVHVNDADRARALLLRSERTPHDPWLTAGELAISSYAGKTPRYIKSARAQLSDRRFNPFQITELAGALGTIEALDGNRKRARDHFAQSLTEPTENALAQAIWAVRSNVKIDVDTTKFRNLSPHEALTWEARFNQDWNGALANCENWLNDESYSKIPALLGSFIASIVGDPEAMYRFARRGFNANSTDTYLKNNLAVAEIFRGEIASGRKLIAEVGAVANTPEEKATYYATSGLAEFRDNHPERGRILYRLAIETCLAASNKRMAAIAAAFWGREELRLPAGQADLPIKLFDQNCKATPEPEFSYFKAYFQNARNNAPNGTP